MELWVVDTSNVMGARPDGWWRDRERALVRLIDELERWRAHAGVELIAVADGEPGGVAPGSYYGVEVRFAGPGRDAADREIERVVGARVAEGVCWVATSDRALRDRVRERGAEVEGAGRFLDRLADIPDRWADRAVLDRFGIDESMLLGRGGEARVFALGDDRVLRLPHPHAKDAALDARRNLLERVLREAPAGFVATPEVLEHRDVDGRTVVLERRLPGVDGRDALGQARGPRRTALVRDMLDVAARIAEVAAPSAEFGELWGDGAITAPTFRQWAAARVQISLDIGGEAFSHVDADEVTDELIAVLAAPEPSAPSLVHLDAFLGNMLVVEDRVSALLDFGPMTIAGPRDVDPLVSIAYLDSEITPTATERDRRDAREWADEREIGAAVEPARRWIAAYWAGAPDDERLRSWCLGVLGVPT